MEFTTRIYQMGQSQNHILLASKHQSRWHGHFISRLRDTGAQVSVAYISDLIKKTLDHPRQSKARSKELTDKLIRICTDHKATYVILDLEFNYILSPKDILRIKKEAYCKCLGCCFDDETLHQLNRYFYQSCDALLVNGPLPKHKYQSYGYDAFDIFPLERPPEKKNRKRLQINNYANKILHFGCKIKGDRARRIELLRSNGFEILELAPGTPFPELYEAIEHCLFTLTFSRSDKEVRSAIDLMNVPIGSYQARKFRFGQDSPGILQLKGRVFEVIMCGSISVTEYTPLINQVIPKEAIVTFRTDEELVEQCRRLISDNELRESIEENIKKLNETSFSKQSLAGELDAFLNSDMNAIRREIPGPSIANTSYLLARRVMAFKNPLEILSDVGISAKSHPLTWLSSSLLAWYFIFWEAFHSLIRSEKN